MSCDLCSSTFPVCSAVVIISKYCGQGRGWGKFPDSNGDFTVATEGGDGDDEDPDNDVSLTWRKKQVPFIIIIITTTVIWWHIQLYKQYNYASSPFQLNKFLSNLIFLFDCGQLHYVASNYFSCV